MLYIAIYIFVHRKFTDFKKQSSCPDRDSDESINYPTTGRNQETTQEKDLNPIVPKRRSQTTSLARNGLLPTPEEGVAEWSDSYFVPTHQSRLQSTDGPRWEGYSFGGSQPVTPLSPTDYAGTPVVVSRSQPEDHHDTPANTPGEAHRHLSLATITTSHTTYNMMQALRSSRMNSMAPTVINSSRVASILKVKTEAVPPDSAFMDTFSPFSVTVRGGQGLPARPTLVQRHRDIKRKLRLLFIYPLVYMLMWLIPFISHCLQYSDSYSKSPSYLLAFFVVGSLGLQGTVDSILFSTREKPWRHLNRHRFFGWGFELSKRKIKGESRFGKDTVVQVAEADLARDRKGDEEEALKVERLPVVAKRPGLARERSWWEVEGRMRMDSVMLGTDRTNMDQVGEQRDLHEDVIREEDVPPMEPDHDAPSKELRFAPEPGRSK
ncbi:hypothetical protein MMC13_000964 [Lambiella insularis]|nr:hypothetical protein [Lambiella insularis]